MRCVVKNYTRLGLPAAMLDPIITTLGCFYQKPVCYPHLAADEGSGGVPSDHLIVIMDPINMVNNKAARTYRSVQARPMPKSAMDMYHMTIKNCEWNKVINAESAYEKAALLQAEHAEIVENWAKLYLVVNALLSGQKNCPRCQCPWFFVFIIFCPSVP